MIKSESDFTDMVEIYNEEPTPITSIEKLNGLIIHLAMVAKIDTVVDSAGMMPTWNSLY